MRKTEYSCDWCKKAMPAKQANHLSIDPVSLPRNPEVSSFDYLTAMDERDRQALEADLCDACVTELRRWIEGRGAGL